MTRLFCTAVAAAAFATAAFAAETITEGDLETLDADGDGRLTREEYVAFMDATFDLLDEDEDGVLLPPDLEGLLTPAQIAMVDADGDGRITKSEFDSRTAADFDAADQDGTGMLE